MTGGLMRTGVLKAEDVYGDLGEIACRREARPRSDDQITIADLTGLGVQDAAAANWVVARAIEANAGESL